MSSSLFDPVCPGGVFVVEDAVAEAAVQDADESVGQGSQGSVVGVAGGPPLVMKARAPGLAGEGGEGPQVGLLRWRWRGVA